MSIYGEGCYSLYRFLVACWAHFTDRFTVPPIQIVPQIDWNLDLLLHWEVEEGRRDCQLPKDLFVFDAVTCNDPKPDIADGVLQLRCESLFLTRLVEA